MRREQLCAGSLERAETAANAARAAVQRERRMVARTQALAERLQALRWPELRVEWALCDGLNHGAVMAPALIDAHISQIGL